MTTDVQDRIADALVSDPRWGRADVIPRPNAEIEVWLYDTEGVLETISVVKPDGSTRTRPGVRYTDDTYIVLDRWRSPASEYPRRRLGDAEVRTKWYTPGAYACYMQRGYSHYYASKRLYITGLEIGGKTWMVDDPPHWWAMEDHAAAYAGHVVCAGLGLGLIVHTLDANPAVERITVIERERDVIELIGPQVPDGKLTIIEGTWEDFDPASIPPANGVLYDLLVGNAMELIGKAVDAATEALVRWDADDDFVVRVHGFPPSLIDRSARVRRAAA